MLKKSSFIKLKKLNLFRYCVIPKICCPYFSKFNQRQNKTNNLNEKPGLIGFRKIKLDRYSAIPNIFISLFLKLSLKSINNRHVSCTFVNKGVYCIILRFMIWTFKLMKNNKILIVSCLMNIFRLPHIHFLLLAVIILCWYSRYKKYTCYCLLLFIF